MKESNKNTQEIPQKQTFQKHFFWIALPLFVYAAIISLAPIASRSLWIDEGYSVITALTILQHGIPLFDTGFFDPSYLLLHYLQALSFVIFGYSPWAARIVPVLIGWLAIAITYRIGRQVWDVRVGIIAALLSAFSYPFVVAVTEARYYSLLALFYLVGISLSLDLLKSPSVRRFFIVLNVAFFGIIFHPYLYALLPLIALASVFALIRSRDHIFTGQIPLVAFAAIANGMTFYVLIQLLVPSSSTTTILATVSRVAFDYTPGYAYFFFLEMGAIFFFLYIAIVLAPFQRRPIAVCILLIAFFFPLLAISRSVFLYAPRYVYFLIPLVFLISIGSAWGVLSRLRNTLVRRIITAIGTILIFATTHFVWYPSSTLAIHDLTSPEPDFANAYATIRKHSNFSGTLVISAYPPMDRIYLGKSDGYLYIDETGMGTPPDRNYYVHNGKNIFTGTPLIRNLEHLKQIIAWHSAYIIIDGLARMRLRDTDILRYIERGDMLYEKNDNSGYIRVYLLH